MGNGQVLGRQQEWLAEAARSRLSSVPSHLKAVSSTEGGRPPTNTLRVRVALPESCLMRSASSLLGTAFLASTSAGRGALCAPRWGIAVWSVGCRAGATCLAAWLAMLALLVPLPQVPASQLASSGRMAGRLQKGIFW